MTITTSPTIVNASVNDVYYFLSTPRNIEELISGEDISDFQSTDIDCNFKVKGGIQISLIKTTSEFPNISYKSGVNAPFKYELNVYVSEIEDKSKGYIEFNGDVNAFIKLLVEKPLTNLFERMKQKLEVKFNN